MRSTVNLAVLGLVIERPSYGYELSRRCELRFDGLLDVGRSHVYAALDSLQRDGLIEPLPSPLPTASARQPRIHYRATEAGTRTFHVWIGEQQQEAARHAQVLARLAAIGAEETAALAALVDGYEREALADRDGALEDGDAEEPLVTRLLREERRRVRDAQRDWLDWARRELAAHEQRTR